MSEQPYKFGGPESVAATVGAAGKLVSGAVSGIARYKRKKAAVDKMLAKAGKAGEAAGRVEGFTEGTETPAKTGGNSREAEINALTKGLNTLLKTSGKQDAEYAKTKGRERRLTTSSSVRNLNKIQAKGGTKMSATMGRKGSVSFEGTRAPSEAPKPRPTKQTPAKPATKAVAKATTAKKATAKPVAPAQAKKPVSTKTKVMKQVK